MIVVNIPNNQTYQFARDSWISKMLLPEIVDLVVETKLVYNMKDNKVESHRDIWMGKSESALYQQYGKPIVGSVLSKIFQWFGW